MTTLLEHLEGLNERAAYPASNYHEAARAREAFIELDELRRMYFPAFLEAVRCLQLVLPLAKGYAAANRVGSNAEYVADADAALAPFMEQVK